MEYCIFKQYIRDSMRWKGARRHPAVPRETKKAPARRTGLGAGKYGPRGAALRTVLTWLRKRRQREQQQRRKRHR